MQTRIKASQKIMQGDRLALDKQGCVRRAMTWEVAIGTALTSRSAGNLVTVAMDEAQPIAAPVDFGQKPNRETLSREDKIAARLAARAWEKAKESERQRKAQLADEIKQRRKLERAAAIARNQPQITSSVKMVKPGKDHERNVAAIERRRVTAVELLTLVNLDKPEPPAPKPPKPVRQPIKPGHRHIELD